MNDEGTIPPKVSREKLKVHFKTAYSLSDDQIQVMLESSAQSLHKTLNALNETLNSEADLKEISRFAHSLKGLLLNMGEGQWAEIARDMERSSAQGEMKDYREIVECVRRGVEDIL